LRRRYGPEFAPHPHLWHALQANGGVAPGLLNGERAALAWARGDYAALLSSLACKVSGIADLFERVCRGTFRASGATPEPRIPVTLRGPQAAPLVLGKPKPNMTTAQYHVVEALLAAGDAGLTKDELVTASGHGDARHVLKRLADSDPDWHAVIHFPGKTGGRYRVT
jgi:hypothetical protein